MKKPFFYILLTILLINHNFLANAQQEKLNNRFSKNSLFLFNSFEEGIVYFKDGNTSKAKLNYDVVDNDICYLNNNQILTISDLEEIDSIKIGNKYFCYIEKKILETVSSKKISVLLYRKVDISTSQEPSGAYGTSSSTSSISKRTSLSSNLTNFEASHCNIQTNDDVEFPITEKQYLLINGKLILATQSQINNQFRDHKKEIKDFIKENNINIHDIKDLINLATFLEKFLNENKI